MTETVAATDGPDDGDGRYQRLLEENFELREKVRNLEEDIEALQWDIKLRRIRSPWRELPTVGRRLRSAVRRERDSAG